MSSTTEPDNRSSAEIERDVERTRDKLRDTLEALRDRASPGQLFEQVLDYATESGAPEMMRNMGRTMRDNPLPTLLIGAGIAWMMVSGRNGASDGGTYDRGDDHDRGRRWDTGPDGRRRMARMRQEGESMMGRASAAVSETASGVRDSVADAAGRVSEAAGGIADSARETAEQVGEMASSAYRRVTDAASNADARGYVRDARHQADRGVRWLLQEQPLLLGALGLAVGAAVGALIPRTRVEDRWMGEAREELMGQARQTAEEAYEGVKDEARHLAGEASEGSGIAGAVRNAVHGARETVTQAARDVVDQAKAALDPSRGEEPARPATRR